MTPDTGLPMGGAGAAEIVPTCSLVCAARGTGPIAAPPPPPTPPSPPPPMPVRLRRAGVACGFALWTAIALAGAVFLQAMWSSYSSTLREIDSANRRINEVSREAQLARQNHPETPDALKEDWSELMRRSLVLYQSIEVPPSWLAHLLGGSTGIALFQHVYAEGAEPRLHPETPPACPVWADTPPCRDYLGAATTIEEARKRDAAFLSFYLLPMLWGLVGASIYVLRDVGNALEREAHAIPALRHGLRILLGGALGPIIGHVLATQGLAAAGSSVLPFVTAFYAGYNIEAVLEWLDKLSAAVGGKPRGA